MGAAPLTREDFTARLAPLAPTSRLIAGVSGGADSLALALLAHEWAITRGGTFLAAICDHGLRPGSAAEADAVAGVLQARGIPAQVIRLTIPPGPALQERARTARLEALLRVCTEHGAPYLLLGHHRADQAETVLMRALAGSGNAGLAGIPRVRAAEVAVVLRPLLDTPPERLVATVAAAGLTAVRDPSNADPRFTRARLRRVAGAGRDALFEAASRFAARRAAEEAAVAERLALAATLHPEGFARLDTGALGSDGTAAAALRTMIRTITGRAFAPSRDSVASLLRRGQGTLAGAVLRRDGVLAREAADLGPPVPARHGAMWDSRFRLAGPGDEECHIAALGIAPPDLLRPSWLPGPALRSLPAIRRGNTLVAVPHLAYPDPEVAARYRLCFAPASGPAA